MVAVVAILAFSALAGLYGYLVQRLFQQSQALVATAWQRAIFAQEQAREQMTKDRQVFLAHIERLLRWNDLLLHELKDTDGRRTKVLQEQLEGMRIDLAQHADKAAAAAYELVKERLASEAQGGSAQEGTG